MRAVLQDIEVVKEYGSTACKCESPEYYLVHSTFEAMSGALNLVCGDCGKDAVTITPTNGVKVTLEDEGADAE